MKRDFIRSRITVLVEGISEPQWHEFSQAICSLPVPPHVTLVKPLSVLPLVFYQLPEALALETQAKQAALQELANIEQLLGFATVHRLLPANQLAKWLPLWRKENDHVVIGKNTVENKTTFFSPLSAIMDMAAWLACMENIEKNSLEYAR